MSEDYVKPAVILAYAEELRKRAAARPAAPPRARAPLPANPAPDSANKPAPMVVIRGGRTAD